MNLFDTIEHKLLPYVEKPLRYVGNELNIIRKNVDDIVVHGILCFPDLYEIGMSHFGSQILYHIINGRKDWALARAYCPWIDAQNIMLRESIPLCSLEYTMPLCDADIVGFTVQYELQYTNMLTMLKFGNIPLYSIERDENDPIVIAGGPCMGNSEPIADFIDAIVVGDGEVAIVDIFATVEQAKKENCSRKEIIKKLALLKGVYVPSQYKMIEVDGILVAQIDEMNPVVQPAKIPELLDEHYPNAPLVPLLEIVHPRLSVEVMRGCTRGCRFCSAGYYYRPVRERNVDDIISGICCGIEQTGWDETGLLSLSTADYSRFKTLIDKSASVKRDLHTRISLPSTRIDALGRETVEKLNKVSPSSSLTIAPEAGSQRLRDVINKDFKHKTIIDTVRVLLDNNIQTLKLYFMIGLPTETEEDIEAIINLVAEIADIVYSVSKRRKVNVSISPFSPKPHTPFQWEKMDAIDTLNGYGRRIKYALRSRRNVSVSYRDAAMTFLESVFARGDRSLSKLIETAWRNGAKFDGWNEFFDLQKWQIAAKEAGVDLARFTAGYDLSAHLAWDVVSVGMEKPFLLREREKAFEQKITSDCRDGSCDACGVCNQTLKSLFAESDVLPVEMSSVACDKTLSVDTTKQYIYRIAYEKLRPVRFLSHRNMMNVILRAVSAAKIPVAFSQGYHPHPRLSFGPPLNLGVMGEMELLDIVTTEDVAWDLNKINRWLPDGMALKSVERCIKKLPSITSQVTASQYRFTQIDSSQLINDKLVYQFLDKNTVDFEITKKNTKKIINIRSLVYDMTIEHNDEDGRLILRAFTAMLPGKTCRPADLMKAIFPDIGDASFLFMREHCLCGDKNKLNIMC